MSNEENPDSKTRVDITDESGEVQVEQELPADHVPDLQVKLEEALTKADDYYDKLMRSQAEMENIRKRSQRELENAHKYAIEKFVNELLPVIDSMELGQEAAKTATDMDSIREGVSMTHNMFMSTLEKFDIEVVNPEGDNFDPEIHQAMSMQETADAQPNSVIGVMQKGYTLAGRLLRPAMVVVAKAPTEAQETES